MKNPKGAFALPKINPYNLLLNTDSYKASHFRQYRQGSELVSSYIEARAGDGETSEMLFFGLQIFLMQYLSNPITGADVEEAEAFWTAHGEPFNRQGWMHIVDHHKGRLPVRIEAVKEGSLISVKNVLVQIVNTDPACFWLTSYLETALLRAVWYPTTVATRSRAAVEMIRKALVQTDGDDTGLEFKLHDFGARGATSLEQAGIGGCAHLVNSMGTDTAIGAVYARNFYGADMAGFSIPAAEHSTMTAWGGEAGELEAMRNIITQHPSGLVACVSDSYDLFRAIEDYWGDALKDAVLSRADGFLVVRPDSGNPTEIVPKVIEALGAKFGFETTTKGYRILNPKVRVLQGDGITQESLEENLEALVNRGLAIGNIAFGMGGGLLQKVDRDTFAFAMKASAIWIDGKWQDVFKDPKTAAGTKTSKKGRLALVKDAAGCFRTIRFEELKNTVNNLLETVYENGEIKRFQTFDEIRALARTT